MFIIKRGRLMQYIKRSSTTPKSADVTNSKVQKKGKKVEQEVAPNEQSLWMVPMITRRAKPIEAKEQKSKQQK